MSEKAIAIEQVRAFFGNPSPKEEAMFQAVVDIIKERKNIAVVKVSDITTRAGVGKGTAYEYFTSKEEIVIKALLFETFKCMKVVELILKSEKNFKEKFYWLIEYLDANAEMVRMLNELLHVPELANLEAGTEEQFSYAKKYVDSVADYYLECGVREGIISEQDVVLRRNFLYSQVLGYMVLLLTDFHEKGTNPEQAKEFAYRTMVRGLTNLN